MAKDSFPDEDLPYRTGVPMSTPKAPGSTPNEQNYDTLRVVQSTLNLAMEGLYEDFNAFDVSIEKDEIEAAKQLLRQISAKQGAYDILLPIQDAVNTAVARVDNKYKQR